MALALSSSCFDPCWVLLGLRFPSIEERFGTNRWVLMLNPVAGQGSKTYTAVVPRGLSSTASSGFRLYLESDRT